MRTYIVTAKQTGQVVYAYQSDAPIEWHGMEFATHEHTLEPEEITDVTPRMASERDLTKLMFRRLFTTAEQKMIDRFNATFESHTGLTDDQKDDVRTGLENYKAAGSVSLDDPDTAAVLGLYTALGILAAGRMQEILA